MVLNAGKRERVAGLLARRCAGFEARVEDLSLLIALIAV